MIASAANARPPSAGKASAAEAVAAVFRKSRLLNTILVPLFLIGARDGTARLYGEAFMPKKYWKADFTVSR
ncbi:hypothetical protein AGR1A_pAt20075 [Agrobacterium fabacearum CFBP 5771]|nr:hypothetical protein AGR1C_pAt20196 [Agrobacterium fabacearum TT111]CVI23940.1 hypothetical protein AGR1A_pAt20075 [Agrobacterium fabacearum CFBP 5771]